MSFLTECWDWINQQVFNRSIASSINTLISSLSNYQITSQKNQPNGYAGLNGSGLVDSSLLPSYVDDVLEYDTLSIFPAVGEYGKIYLDKTTNLIYRWGGSVYVLVGGDFSLYQLKSEKNANNGYMGLDANGRVDSIEKLLSQKQFGYYFNFLHSGLSNQQIGANGSSGSCQFLLSSSNPTSIVSGSTGNQFLLPILRINSGAGSGLINTSIGFNYHKIDSPTKLIIEFGISIQNIVATQNAQLFSVGDLFLNANGSITGSVSGFGLFFYLDPTVNSGLWRVGKVVNSVSTFINTSVAPVLYTPIFLRIEYDKATEIAIFYINNVIVHTMQSVNLSSITSYVQRLARSSNINNTIQLNTAILSALFICEIN